MKRIIFVYITNPSKKVARNVADMLLKKQLIACANIFPVESMYRWKRNIVHEKEWVTLCKTTGKQYAHIQKEVRAIHPYTIPCIIKIPISANTAYGKWLNGQLKRG